MLLTMTTKHHPATDLGFLLHKNRLRFQSLDLPFGQAQVFLSRGGNPRIAAPAHVNPEYGVQGVAASNPAVPTDVNQTIKSSYEMSGP